jgi:F-type H+-transporting ATPase subunit b
MFKVQDKKRVLFSAIFFILFSFLFYCPALGEERSHPSVDEAVHTADNGISHEGGHSEDRSADLIDLLYRFESFLLLVIILFIVIKKTKITDYFSARSEEIRNKLEDLRREKEETESKYQEMEKKLKEFEGKRKEIIDQYKKEGLAEKDKIIEEAKVRVKQIIDQSEMTIQQEIQAARDSLKFDIVELAAQKAQQIISREMDERDQNRLITEFLERVGKEN